MYKACVGYGVVISKDNKELINRINRIDENGDYFILINSYSDNSDWFLGKLIATKDEYSFPDYINLSDKIDIVTDMQVKEILANFDIHKQPSLYLLLMVN